VTSGEKRDSNWSLEPHHTRSMSKLGKTVVAMSGGVDSSTAACLLKEEGHEVIGVTMHVWPHEQTGGGRCCAPHDVEDARLVANRMGFPYYLLDCREEFKKYVIDNFIEEYRGGRTPNPCIRCNEFLKFGWLVKKAGELDAEHVATGHYARLDYDRLRKRYILLRGIDEKKEQTYFLYSLKQRQLAHVRFPVGGYTKDEVRELAGDFGLKVSEKKGSQEICFIDERGYANFLKGYIPQSFTSGAIVDKSGEVIGQHRGIGSYTVGQRKGLGLPGPEPHYVVELRPHDNTIVVGSEADIYRTTLQAEKVNIIAFEELPTQLDVTAKIRYQSRPATARVDLVADDHISVEFAERQWAITPGQAVVMYQGDLVVGGATIITAGGLQ